MSGPWEQFSSGGAQPPFSVSTADQAAQVYGQGGMSKQQLETISQDMFKRGTGGTAAFKAPAAAPWKKFSGNQAAAVDQPKGFFGTLAKDPFQEFAQHNLVLNLYRAAKNGNLEKFLKDPKLVHSTLHDLPHEMKVGLESFVKQAVQDPGGAAAQLINGIVADPEMLFLGGIEGGAVRRTLLGAATGGAIGAGSEAGSELAKHPELNVGQVVQSATGGAVTGGAFAGVLGHGGKEPEPKAAPPEPTPIVSPELSKALQAKSAEVYAKTPEEHIHAGLQIGPQPEPVAEVPTKVGMEARMYGAADVDVLKKLGIAAGGAVAFSYLDPQDKWKSYATGAALGLAGAWLAPRVKDGLAADSRVRIDKYANDFEAASQLAEVRLHQQVGAIRKALPNAEDRAAVTRAIDEGKPAATPEQAKVQAAVKQFFSDVGRLAQEHGVLKELRDNYVTHLWDNPVNRSRFGSALTTTSPFTKSRTFTTLAEGKAAGLVPRTEDIADIMEAYGRSMNRAMQGKTFIGTLKGLKAPDGRPLIAKADAAPKGYVPVNLPQLRGSLVHPDIAQSLSMFESGRLHGPLEGVSESMQALKRIKVMGSLFHIKSLAEAGIGSTPVTKWGALPKRIAGFALGRDEMLKQLNEGGMSQDTMDLLRHGINISLERETPGVEDIGGSFYQGMTNLQQYLDANLPQAGKVSKAFTELNHKLDTITWGRVHTGLKLMVGSETMHRLERNGVPRETAAEIAANFVNTQFGGLNWRRIAEGARSRWGRDFSMAMLHPKARTVSQILLFAPDWTISTIRQYTQAIRRSGGPLEQAKGLLKPTELADLHRLALLRGAMYYLAVGDAVNYMLSGHHLWQNKNPLRIDLGNGQTMQFSKHLTEPLEWVHAPAKTAAGKLSYMVTEPIDQLTGKEYIGGPPMQESPVVHAAEGLLPFPATSGGPAQAVAGMAGFPIYGHTPEQMREIARERRERKNTPEARAHRRKLREERRNY